MFERSLSSLIKGLRSHRGKDEARYVATLMEEIKVEIRSGDMEIKAEAILKLTYLQMLGYTPSNASFHMLEVMASPRFHLKQVGYLAASQTFSQDTDVLILATNLIKKDLRSPTYLDVAIALNGLAQIITPDLAQHLAPDVITLLNHTKPIIRKRALLVLHAIILQYPPALEQALGRISEKLEDSDSGVVSATVNIVCELARRDEELAKAFLPLSPQLFHLLTNSTNNWMLIKIIKLFGVLTPAEPRLAKKLLPPIKTIISTTPAMSLLYECMHTVIIGGMLEGAGGDELAATCSEKLGVFLDDDDQNLRYIALLALVKILPSHPHLVAVHQDRIFESMDDEDLSIRFRALDLVSGMASRENFMDIVEQQLRYLDPSKIVAKQPSAAQALRQAMQSNGGSVSEIANSSSSSWITASYRLEIINRILDLGSQDTYTNIVDFEWYVDILIRLHYLAGQSIGNRVQDQLIDISARVRGVRDHAIYKLKQVLEDFFFIDDQDSESKNELFILRAAAWICGEYCQNIAYPPAVISLLLRQETLLACDSETCAIMVHNGMKLFAWWLLEQRRDWKQDKLLEIKKITEEVVSSIENTLAFSTEAELQERLTEFEIILKILQGDLENQGSSSSEAKEANPETPSSPSPPKSLQLLSPLFFGHALGPVAKKAQGKVLIPSGLDLDSWLVEPGKVRVVDSWEVEEAAQKAEAKIKRKEESVGETSGGPSKKSLESQERKRLKAEREKRQSESPFYLGSKPKSTKLKQSNLIDEQDDDDIDSIPIVQLQLDETGKEVGLKEDDSKIAKPTRIQQQQEEEEMPEKPPEVKTKVVRKTVNSNSNGKKKKRTKDISESTLQ